MAPGRATSGGAVRFCDPIGLSHARLGRIVDQSVNEIYVFDATTLRFLTVNRGACANLGYGLDELEGLTPVDLKPEFTRSSFERLLRPLGERQREQLVFQTVHRRKDGSRYDVEVRLQLMREGGPPVFLAVIEDITERLRIARDLQRTNEELEQRVKDRTAALRDSQERLVSALRASGTGTYRWNIRTDIVECGSQLLRLFGVSPGDDLHCIQDFVDLIHPEDRDAVAASVKRCVTEGADFDMMFRIVRPDGSIRWLADKGKMTCDVDGRPSYLIGACTDVTEHERTREALRRSETKFRQLAENISDVLWVGTADWRQVTYVNKAYEELWGRPCQSLYENGLSWLDHVHPDDRARVEMEVRNKADASPHFDPHFADYRVVRPDGSLRWVSARAYPVADERGQVQLIAGIVEDITARKRAEERQRLVMGELNHRIKNILMMVNSLAKQTMRHSASADEFEKAFGDRLRALACAHDNLLRVDRQEVPLRSIIERMRESFRDDDADNWLIKGSDVVLVPPDRALLLNLILHELATNASKYGALAVPSGRVQLSYEMDRDERLVLRWVESGGPEVAVPSQRGFGSKLIADIVTSGLGGRVDFDYSKSGLRCEVAFHLRRQ